MSLLNAFLDPTNPEPKMSKNAILIVHCAYNHITSPHLVEHKDSSTLSWNVHHPPLFYMLQSQALREKYGSELRHWEKNTCLKS